MSSFASKIVILARLAVTFDIDIPFGGSILEEHTAFRMNVVIIDNEKTIILNAQYYGHTIINFSLTATVAYNLKVRNNAMSHITRKSLTLLQQ